MHIQVTSQVRILGFVGDLAPAAPVCNRVKVTDRGHVLWGQHVNTVVHGLTTRPAVRVVKYQHICQWKHIYKYYASKLCGKMVLIKSVPVLFSPIWFQKQIFGYPPFFCLFSIME